MKNYFFLFLLLFGCSIYKDVDYPSEIKYFEVYPSSETQPVSSKDDAADDIAIWVNDLNVENTIIIGTNKPVSYTHLTLPTTVIV